MEDYIVRKRSLLLSLLALIIISLFTGCGKKDKEVNNDVTTEVDNNVNSEISNNVNPIVQEDESQVDIETDNEPYSEYPDYFKELLLTLEKHETDRGSFVDDQDTELKSYLEIPEDQTIIGYVDNYMKYEEEKIYNIQWMNLGNEKIFNDLSFDLSGFQVENKRWDHSENYYNEEQGIVYLVFTAFPLWLHDETLSMSGSHRILMLVEFKLKTPKQYSVTVFQTDEHGGAECFIRQNVLTILSIKCQVWLKVGQ